jgi:hypothetical protein
MPRWLNKIHGSVCIDALDPLRNHKTWLQQWRTILTMLLIRLISPMALLYFAGSSLLQ